MNTVYLNVTTSGSNQILDVIISPSALPSDPSSPLVAGATNFRGLVVSNTGTARAVRLSGHITQDWLGQETSGVHGNEDTTCHSLFRFDVDGTFRTSLTVLGSPLTNYVPDPVNAPTDAYALSVLAAGAISEFSSWPATITVQGNVDSITSQGNWQAALNVPGYRINKIEAGGTIGATTNLISGNNGESYKIRADKGIRRLAASGLLTNVMADGGIAGDPAGKFRSVAIGSGGVLWLHGAGIENVGASPGIAIAGQLKNRIVLSGSVAAPISVGSVLNSASEISAGGPVLANITSASNLGKVSCGTSLGTLSAPISITAASSIDSISTNDFYGTCTANNGASPISSINILGNLAGTLKCSTAQKFTVGTLTGTAEFTGGLAAGLTYTIDSHLSGTMKFGTDIIGTLNVGGNMSGSLEVGGKVSGAVNVAGQLSGLCRVQGELASGAQIVTGSSSSPGLPGQVVLNASNTTFGTGNVGWNGLVKVGGSSGTVLTRGGVAPPGNGQYSQLMYILGNGAVGLGAYSQHDGDSSPTQDPSDVDWLANPPGMLSVPMVMKSEWIPVTGIDKVRSVFYGPLLTPAAAGVEVDPRDAGVTVWYSRSGAFDGSESDVSDEFKAVLPAGQFNRALQIRPACNESYLYLPDSNGHSSDISGVYRVLKNAGSTGSYANRPRSRYVGVPGSEPELEPFALYFRFWCSDADLGQVSGIPGSDGILDNNDFVAFINYFFASDPHADIGTTGGVPGHDGVWDNNDYIVFIELFFAGCDSSSRPCPGFRAGVPGGGEQSMQAQSIAGPGLSAEQLQQQLAALAAAYHATHDERILERIDALMNSGSSDR